MPKKSHYAMPHHILNANTNNIQRKLFDLSYADISSTQKLDIYWPAEGNGPFPVIVAIHGGAFMGGDKQDMQLTPMLNGLSYGYAIVSINYRMSGEAIFPALIQDVKAAIRWIRGNALEYMFDPNFIATWGGSAGGYLSLMAAVSNGVPALTDLSLGNAEQSEDVQAAVSWFPPVDFLRMDEQLAVSGFELPDECAHSGKNSPESLILGGHLPNIPERVKQANPETYIHSDVPPLFIQHGTKDTTVPYQQSMNFAEKVDKTLTGDVHYELLINARHGDSAFESKDNIQKIINFLDRCMKTT